MLVLGYLQGEAWPHLVERQVVACDFAMFRLLCSVIACTARYGQIVFTGVDPRSSLEQRGMATMSAGAWLLARRGMATFT